MLRFYYIFFPLYFKEIQTLRKAESGVPNSPNNVPPYWNPSDRKLPLAKAVDSLPLLTPLAPFAKNTQQEEVFPGRRDQDTETV